VDLTRPVQSLPLATTEKSRQSTAHENDHWACTVLVGLFQSLF